MRGKKVMLDSDLARLYQVETKVLNQAVKRNIARFPEDFMFQLTSQEVAILRLQFGTSSWGGRRYSPAVFTEHGTVMLATVLNSDIAIQTSVQVVRAFTRLREMLATHKDLAKKLEALEKKYDSQFAMVFKAIRELMEPPVKEKKKSIGFRLGKIE
jgi:hypothetical protein